MCAGILECKHITGNYKQRAESLYIDRYNVDLLPRERMRRTAEDVSAAHLRYLHRLSSPQAVIATHVVNLVCSFSFNITF